MALGVVVLALRRHLRSRVWGGRVDFPAPGKRTSSHFRLKRGVHYITVPFQSKTKHPVLTRPISEPTSCPRILIRPGSTPRGRRSGDTAAGAQSSSTACIATPSSSTCPAEVSAAAATAGLTPERTPPSRPALSRRVRSSTSPSTTSTRIPARSRGVHHAEFRSVVEPCWDCHVHFVSLVGPWSGTLYQKSNMVEPGWFNQVRFPPWWSPSTMVQSAPSPWSSPLTCEGADSG